MMQNNRGNNYETIKNGKNLCNTKLANKLKKLIRETISELGGESQSDRWLKDPHWQNFLRQIHTDMYVGLKNGVSDEEVAKVVDEFLAKAREIMIPRRVRK